MFLSKLSLQNFRSYKKQDFHFSKDITLIVGPNTAGKTNFMEAVFFLSSGKSFRTDKDEQIIKFGEEIARLSGLAGDIKLEIIIAKGSIGGGINRKKYMVNGVSKRRADFMGNLQVVLFSPLDLDMIIGSPGLRRNFLNSVLEATDSDYRIALLEFIKGLRQRNALLERARETGVRDERQFEYWDNILVKTGKVVAQKREEFIKFINSSQKDIFDFIMVYDKSTISYERLLQYKEAELGSGVTLVGPHRDDFSIHMFDNLLQTTHDVKFFGSRGQQRLVVLQLKLLELQFIEEKIGERPVLLLDDIFSELDSGHINLVLDIISKQQTIVTTTHKEFIPKKMLDRVEIIELGRRKA
ncbi:MAG: hypothetical protein A3B41_02285 [Candidatus Levybacteria bacterium RIFCSPLOWO2_01_FULL_37_26]|nr:MAG: hypothetical protein A3B41_02285 [Candidatus Levybacteria bacterium RIFCSPLOWO2_01_FULL_37_26]